MRLFLQLFILVVCSSSSLLWAEEVTDTQSQTLNQEQKDTIVSRQLTFLLKSYYGPATRALAGLHGKMTPFVVYLKSNGDVGHNDLSGVEPTNDPEVVEVLVAKHYKSIYEERDNYEAFGIFAVTKLDIDGVQKDALTVMMEHKQGVAIQRVWPFTIEDGLLKIGQVTAIPAVNVIFTD